MSTQRAAAQLVACAVAAVRRGAYGESVRLAERALTRSPSLELRYVAHRIGGASLLVLGGSAARATTHVEAALDALQSGLVGRDDFADLVGVLNDVALARVAVGRVEDGLACLRRGLFAARRGFRPSPELARATLLHLALAADTPSSLQSAMDLLPEAWLASKTTTLWDAPCVLVAASTLALRNGDLADACYTAQLAVEAAALAPTTDYARRPLLMAIARAQRGACALARRARGHDDGDLHAAAAALATLAAFPTAHRTAATAHLALALDAPAARRRFGDRPPTLAARALDRAGDGPLVDACANDLHLHLGFRPTVPGMGVLPPTNPQWWQRLQRRAEYDADADLLAVKSRKRPTISNSRRRST